jgi:3D (Asp-Asp-Asp) domain-containing protein
VKATAFSTDGVTRAGGDTHVGIVAADPKVLPLGTRIRVTGAGRYSGTYVVTDTGSRINGREIDIFIPNRAEAKRFGEKIVRVHVLKWGELKPNELARK